MDSKDIQRHCEYESDFFAIVIALFSHSNLKDFEAMSIKQLSIEQLEFLQQYISDLFVKYMNGDTEIAVGFFSFLLLKCATYYHLLTPKDESTLQRSLADALRFAAGTSNPESFTDKLNQVKENFVSDG